MPRWLASLSAAPPPCASCHCARSLKRDPLGSYMRLLAFLSSIAIAAPACARTSAPRAAAPIDSLAAVRIAEGAWRQAFGKLIDSERPFRARLVDSVWEVSTSYPPPGYLGGGAHATIARRDGRLIKVWHEQ